MPLPNLEKCSFFGPHFDDSLEGDRGLPPDSATHPFKYLPPRITLSEAERDLANRYGNRDLSGGYVTSQIAYMRRGPSAKEHEARKERFRHLKVEVDLLQLVFPSTFVELVESDDFVTRLRHNNIRLRLPDDLVALPSNPECRLFLIFAEGQGCGYWHLLLAPGTEHAVTFSEHPIGLRGMYAPGREPDLATLKLFQCARNFNEWIVSYFQDSIRGDKRYEEILEKYPGA